MPNFKTRLRIMLSLIHPKYNIFKRYALKLQRTKEGIQRRLTEYALFSILSSVGHKIVHYYLHFPFHIFVIPHVLFQKQSLANVLYIRCFKKLRNIDRKARVLESLLNKAAGLKDTNFAKEIPTQRFSCEYCKIFKNTFFYWTSLTPGSVIRLTCYCENAFFI